MMNIHLLLRNSIFLFLVVIYSSALAFTPPGYAIASAHPLATAAGLEILAKGGNAFDAAVAVSAALAVVEPYHSGLGGGGFWLLHEEKTKKNIFIDGREVAPLAATANMFLDSAGQLIPGLSLNGGLAAAIPGEPAALAYIASHFGRLTLATSLAPAIRLAEKGFVVDQQLAYFLTMGDRQQQLQKCTAAATIFLHNGKPYQIGERLVQRDLAKTLKLLAEKGHAGFYQGETAKHLVTSVRQAGGIWTNEDMASYQVKVSKPLEGAFHHMHIITAPWPSAGGIVLLTTLNILSAYPLQSLTPAQTVHYLTEAMRLAYWQRSQLIPTAGFIKKLLSAENADYLRSLIKVKHATQSASLPNTLITVEKVSNTSHFSIIDSDGNRVAATLSINYIFGSSVVGAGTGVLLNDEMDDFSIKPNTQNVFGLLQSEANAIAPGKRPSSSMTPTFLEMPGRIAILGTPGGSRIPTMVLLAALKFYDSFGAISMVSAMRFHHQYFPDLLFFEPDTFSEKLQQKLLQMGYHLVALKQYYGDMQAITWDQQRNLITAASDPRHIGLATVIARKNEGGYGVKD